MRVNEKMIRSMVWALNYILMVANIKDNLLMGKNMEKDNISGKL